MPRVGRLRASFPPCDRDVRDPDGGCEFPQGHAGASTDRSTLVGRRKASTRTHSREELLLSAVRHGFYCHDDRVPACRQGVKNLGLDNHNDSVTLGGMAASEITLLPGAGGWVQARFDLDGAPRHVFVRFEPDSEGRWRAAEASVPRPTPQLFQRIPFHRIELAVSADSMLRDALARRLGEDPEPGFRGAFGEPTRGEPLLIKRPAGRRLDDSFYERVGVVYRQAIGRGLKPRQAISEAAGVSPDVAGRWIYEARKRGLIPKTTPGKVARFDG